MEEEGGREEIRYKKGSRCICTGTNSTQGNVNILNHKHILIKIKSTVNVISGSTPYMEFMQNAFLKVMLSLYFLLVFAHYLRFHCKLFGQN